MTELAQLLAQADALALAGEPVPLDLETRIAAYGVSLNDINDYSETDTNG